MDIKIDLEKSNYINHRKDLMKNLEIPRLSEANDTLGDRLAKIVFDECDPALKVAFGLEPPLKGASGDLWVSPSNLLIGKIALTPPHTRKHIQALTHEGILNIGAGIEKKFLNEMGMEKLAALANQEKTLLHSFHDSIMAEIKDVEARERAACQREIERITQEFEIRLVDELHELEGNLRIEYESLAGRHEQILKNKWEVKLKEEVTKTVRRMTEEFLNELARQENVMMQHYKIEMRKKEIQRNYDLGQQQAIYSTNVDQLRHILECKNIANMMYILCMERRKCCKEKTEIENQYKIKLNELNSVISQNNLELRELNSRIKHLIKDVQLRETCILEIIKQFQKFINFALRSAPTQAEFLLSVEKMLVFELTDVILNLDVPVIEPCEGIIPWKTSKNDVDTEEIPGLEIDDFHNCFKELPPPQKEGDDQFLPAFTFKNKLYVREDFRNMLSQGIEITQSNELWTPEIQVLMNTLEKSLRSKQTLAGMEPQKTLDVRVKNIEMQGKPHSIIHFKLAGEKEASSEKPCKRVSVDDEITSISLRKSTMDSERPSLRPTQDSTSAIDFTRIGSEERKKRLIGARSSLELIIKKGSVRYIGKGDPEEIEERLKHETTASLSYESESVQQTFDMPEKQPANKNNSQESSLSSATIDQYSPQNLATPFEFKNLSETCAISEKISPDLVLDTRDSIVLRQVSMIKDREDFMANPKDSLEVTKDSIEAMKDSSSTLKKKTSKLVTARDSVELLRHSKLLLKEPYCIRKEAAKSRSTVSWTSIKDICCERCVKMKESSEVLDGVIQKKVHSGSFQENRSNVKIAQVEVINDSKDVNKSNVSFQPMPIVYEASSDHTEQLSKLYRKSNKNQTKKQKPVKDKFLSLRSTAKVVGASQAKEHQQNSDEFTVDRIHSFITMMREHPNLIKTFTACTR